MERMHTSSATVATESKPTKAKNTTLAAEKMPLTPKGAKGCRLEACANGAPTHSTYMIAITFIPVTTALQT